MPAHLQKPADPCPKITVEVSSGPIRWFEINKPYFSIGRSTKCEVCLDETNSDISRVHCKVEWSNSAFWLIDNGSLNGACYHFAVAWESPASIYFLSSVGTFVRQRRISEPNVPSRPYKLVPPHAFEVRAAKQSREDRSLPIC